MVSTTLYHGSTMMIGILSLELNVSGGLRCLISTIKCYHKGEVVILGINNLPDMMRRASCVMRIDPIRGLLRTEV
eukprot:1352225-Ditylum_brightwellii.AAC.1